jgi:hypothetical protein
VAFDIHAAPSETVAFFNGDVHLGSVPPRILRGAAMSTRINLMMRLLALTVLTAAPVVARADDDLKDDSRRDAHDVKRAVKKAGDHVAEAVCTGTEAECAAEKARHRHREAKQKVHDKVEEAKAEAEEKVK